MKTLKEIDKNEIQYLKRLIIKCLEDVGIKIDDIVLFGSRARGDYSKYSDYDFLIINENTFTIKEKMGISKRIREYLSKFAVDIIIKSEEEIEIQKNQIGTVVREALKEGIKL